MLRLLSRNYFNDDVAIVIAVRQTGYGTRGPRFDALVMKAGRLIEIKGLTGHQNVIVDVDY